MCCAQEVVGKRMDTPTMEDQHHDLLMRTAAVMSILSAQPKDEPLKQQLLTDLGLEFEGWQTSFLNHLRDEELLMMPIFLEVGRKYWGDIYDQ